MINRLKEIAVGNHSTLEVLLRKIDQIAQDSLTTFPEIDEKDLFNFLAPEQYYGAIISQAVTDSYKAADKIINNPS